MAPVREAPEISRARSRAGLGPLPGMLRAERRQQRIKPVPVSCFTGRKQARPDCEKSGPAVLRAADFGRGVQVRYSCGTQWLIDMISVRPAAQL